VKKTIRVVNAQTELLAVKASDEYNPVAGVWGSKNDVVICSREMQDELIGSSVLVQAEEMDHYEGSAAAWLCDGDFLLDPETGNPILRVFKP